MLVEEKVKSGSFRVVWEVLKYRSGAVGVPRRGPEVRWMGRQWACEPVTAVSRGTGRSLGILRSSSHHRTWWGWGGGKGTQILDGTAIPGRRHIQVEQGWG